MKHAIRTLCAATLPGLVCVFVASVPAAPLALQAPPKPMAVPEGKALAEAEKTVRTIFQSDYARKKPADMVEFARKLLKTAEETRDEPAAKYVLYRDASEIAARGGDVALALDAVEALSRGFISDRLELKLTALDTAEKAQVAPGKAVADAALEVAENAVEADEYPAAMRFLKLASVAAARLKVATLIAAVAARSKEVEVIQKAYVATEADRKALVLNPKDAAASARYGRFVCMVKGDWDTGLPLLARGDDDALKIAAEKDQARPTAATDRAELGDRWWSLGEKLDPTQQTEVRLRAYHWYQLALAGGLTGLSKVRAEQRMAEMAKLAEQRASRGGGVWKVIFRSADASIWNTDTNRGKDLFATPLNRAPSDIRYLKLMEAAKGRYVIIEMTKERLGGLTERDGYYWNGTNKFEWKAYHLGISDTAFGGKVEGGVTINTVDGESDYRGWGFGHRAYKGDYQGYGWAGESIGRVVYEISIKTTALTAEESKRLLKKKK